MVVRLRHARLSSIERLSAFCFTDTLLFMGLQGGTLPEIGAGSADGDIPYAMFGAWCTPIQVAQTHQQRLLRRSRLLSLPGLPPQVGTSSALTALTGNARVYDSAAPRLRWWAGRCP